MTISEIFTKTLIMLLLTVSFLLGSYLAFNDKAGAATISYGFSALCLILFLLSRFKKFKAFGVEAELWDDKQREAASLIESLKEMTQALSSYVLDSCIRMGRWSHMPYGELVHLAELTASSLSKMGVSDRHIRDAQKTFFDFVSLDLAIDPAKKFNEAIDKKIASMRLEIERAFPQPINDVQAYNASFERIRKLLDEQIKLDSLFRLCSSENAATFLQTKIRGAAILEETERLSMIEECKAHLEEIDHIYKYGKFSNSSVWSQLDRND